MNGKIFSADFMLRVLQKISFKFQWLSSASGDSTRHIRDISGRLALADAVEKAVGSLLTLRRKAQRSRRHQ
jgi:hypothetical protein